MVKRRQPLSRERILRAALALVDREGLQSLSMRRIGEALGVEAMSLYNHVAGKGAILDGLFETVLSELPPLAPGRPWREALRDRALALRQVLSAHPHTLPLFATRPAVTSASIRYVEEVLAVLYAAGFSAEEGLSALQVLVALVVGHTVATCSPRQPDQSAPDYAALSDEDFPRVREAALLLPAHDPQRELELGLDAMLEGLQARLSRHGRRKRA